MKYSKFIHIGLGTFILNIGTLTSSVHGREPDGQERPAPHPVFPNREQTREMGANNRDLGDILQKRLEEGVRGQKLEDIVRENLQKRGFLNVGENLNGIGNALQKKYEQGLRGPDLKFAIREELIKRGLRDPFNNERQGLLRDRNTQGANSGQLTSNEVQTLKVEEKNMHQEDKDSKSEENLTKDEPKNMYQVPTVPKRGFSGAMPAVTEETPSHEPVKVEEKEAILATTLKRLKEEKNLTELERSRLMRYVNLVHADLIKQKRDEALQKINSTNDN
jgi:hypothetical protein